MSLSSLRSQLKKLARPEKAKILQSFFKTGPGQYGEGDLFIGVPIPDLRKLAKTFQDLSFQDLAALLKSKIHEERMLALLILMLQYQRGDRTQKKQCYDFYFSNRQGINNWDLIDVTAPGLVGHYIFEVEKKPLKLLPLAKSKDLWERRIAIVSTLYFIRKKHFEPTLQISALLLGDDQDLIHKAAGWMLREMGKRDLSALAGFLKSHYRKMPRTMLRYAIEKFPETKRQAYLKGTVS